MCHKSGVRPPPDRLWIRIGTGLAIPLYDTPYDKVCEYANAMARTSGLRCAVLEGKVSDQDAREIVAFEPCQSGAS